MNSHPTSRRFSLAGRRSSSTAALPIKPCMEFDGKQGHGRFQWNRGGWFGGQIGATGWLVLLGCLVIAQGQMAGIAVLALGLLPNIVGIFLWQHRYDLSPYLALQILIGTSGLCALTSVFILWHASGLEHSFQLSSQWFILLLYPGLMLVWHFQERTDRRNSA